ncbi:MAG: DUF3127 domain-containing protein [Prevotellaceae bacterium]|nr:DUF3127 domain-containing protein [Prevotellaceae bacterium]MDY3856155.1 DUF3127 domain-containing protein [Bacteroidaceae bacterium]
MNIQGKIIFVGEPRSGVSQRNNQPWKSQDFVIETHDQYPRKCMFNVFGEDKLNQFNIKVGDELSVDFDIDAHEYNGRWYNSIRAWRVGPIQPAAAPAAPAAPASSAPASAPAANTAATDTSIDDLPF